MTKPKGWLKAVAFIAIGSLFLLNFAGYCFRELRYYKIDEILEIAARQQIGRDREILPNWVVDKKTLEKYYPACCDIGRSQNILLDIGAALVGCRSYSVNIHYPTLTNYADNLSVGHYMIDHCGKTLESARG